MIPLSSSEILATSVHHPKKSSTLAPAPHKTGGQCLHCNRPNHSRKGAKKGKSHLQTNFPVIAQLTTLLVEGGNVVS
jgi:hypothetical protein